MSKPLSELAHIGHTELLTPEPERSLEFFTQVLGMEEEAREGQSAYLRGWGDYHSGGDRYVAPERRRFGGGHGCVHGHPEDRRTGSLSAAAPQSR